MRVNRSRRVLHVVNISFVLPYFIGDQFDFLKARGVEVFVACSDSAHLRNYAAEKHFVAKPVKISRSFDLISDLKSVWKLLTIIKKNKIEIVIGHTPKGALLAMATGYLLGCRKRIYFRHGIMLETSKGFQRKILTQIERLTSFLATDVICVSQSVLDRSSELQLGNPAKNKLLNKGSCNGVDAMKKFNPELKNDTQKNDLKKLIDIKQNEFVVGYVGRIVRDKGIETLIIAWKLFHKKYPKSRLLLIGPIEERNRISTECLNDIQQEPSIVELGLIEDPSTHYSIMNALILPSYREGFPTCVLEASAMQLPVITTRSTGCVDSITENETGLFSAIEPNDICTKLEYLYINREVANEMGKKGRSFVLDNFQQEIIWELIYQQIQ